MTQSPANSQRSTDVLLAAVRSGGDVDAWRALVARLTPRLYRVARGLTAWRVLGAQTVVEHAWRAAIRKPGALDDAATLRQLLLGEVVRRALALSDSPRDLPENEPPERIAAMRAVALLPHPSRAVLVLADVGGISLERSAELLGLPEVRLKSELWHARLAVETLRGSGTGVVPTPPLLVAVDPGLAAGLPQPSGMDAAAPATEANGTDPMDDDDAGVAPLWLEAPPEELLSRLASDLHGRHQRRRLAPRIRSLRLPVLGALLAAVLTAASVLLWHEAPRLVQSVEAAAASPEALPGPATVDGDITPIFAAPAPPPSPPGIDRVARRPSRRGGARLQPRGATVLPPRDL